jgi:hypothetical protein
LVDTNFQIVFADFTIGEEPAKWRCVEADETFFEVRKIDLGRLMFESYHRCFSISENKPLVMEKETGATLIHG